MDFHEDSFNDEELTQMAHEIAEELFPKGPYVLEGHHVIPLTKENIARIGVNNINHRSRSPLRIIDRTPLESNDSLNVEFPAIPEKTKSAPVPKNVSRKVRKQMIQRLEYKAAQRHSMFLPLPYYGGISANVMRERHRSNSSKKNTACIPDFTKTHMSHNENKTNDSQKHMKKRAHTIDTKSIEAEPMKRFSHLHEHKKRKRANTITLHKKRKGKKRAIPKIISPILIDGDNRFVAKQKTKKTNKEQLDTLSPSRTLRSQSHPFQSPTVSLQHDDEYLVECGDSFMFVSSRNLNKKQ